MANKYANLIGTNLIKDEYTKINTGFDAVETDINAVTTDIANHETAADPHDQYALDTDLASLESALEGHELDDTAHGIGAIAQAVDNLEQEVSSHMAENVTDDVHGLSKKIVARRIRSPQSIENDTPTTIIYDVGVTSHTELITYNNGDFTIVDPNIKCVRVNAGISWTPNANGYRLLLASKNNNAYSALSGGITSQQGGSGSWDNKDAFQNISCLFDVVAGDTLQVGVRQNSGGALLTSNRGYVALEVYY